jgi:endonuclease/exonuclease/phosphatase family metal-dependent hydrolase
MRAKLTAVVLTIMTALALIPATRATAAPSSAHLSVMTRNLDLGSDYGPVLTATTAATFAHGVTAMYDEIESTNIPERAAGIAAEIGQTMPDVVSLQEVSLVQRLVPAPTGLAAIETIDQLDQLMSALGKLGLHYTVASSTSEFDVTAPSDAGYYLRVRDGEAILVRSDQPANILSFGNPQSGHFSPSALLTLPTPAGPVTALRGWTAVDVTTAGVTTRVIGTHLDALSPAAAAAQAAEIIAGPANTTLPVVLAGDLNSGPGTDATAYDVVTKSFTDTWPMTKPHDPGLTCCLHGEDAFPYASSPSARIDLVLSRGLTPITDTLIGTSDLTPSGLSPSDHAGVVSRLVATPRG